MSNFEPQAGEQWIPIAPPNPPIELRMPHMTAKQHSDLCQAAEKAQLLADKLAEMTGDALCAPPTDEDWMWVNVAQSFVARAMRYAEKGRP